jgi:hypothetical protein
MPYQPPIYDAEALQALRQRGALSNLFYQVGSNMAGLDMNPYLQQSLETRIRERSQLLDRYEQMARDELIRRRDLQQRQDEMRQAATMSTVPLMVGAGDVGGANQAMGLYTDARFNEFGPAGNPYYPDYETQQYAQLQQNLISQAYANAVNRRDYETAQGIQEAYGLGGRMPSPTPFPTDYEGALEERNQKGVLAQLLVMLLQQERDLIPGFGQSNRTLIEAILKQLGINIPVEVLLGAVSVMPEGTPPSGEETPPPNELSAGQSRGNRRDLASRGRGPG